MADILAELEGILSADEIAKLRGNTAATERLSRASELLSFYDGETETPPAPPQRREAPPVERQPVRGATDDLASVLAELNKVTTTLGGLDERIKTTTNEVINQRGNELIAVSMRNNRELSKIDNKHRAEFNEDLDDAALEAHAAAAAAAGRPFRTITDAYEDMTREARLKKQVDSQVETRVRDELKSRASGQVPGVTPQAASPMIRMLKTPRTSATGAATAGEKAGQALADLLAQRGEVVS